MSRQPVKGRGQSTRLASLGAFQATELPFSSTEPPLAAIAADHRLSLITASSPGPVGKQQARHGRKGGQEKRPVARRTTVPRNTHKHLIRTSDGDRRCAKAATACQQAQVEWSCRGGKMRGGGGCQDKVTPAPPLLAAAQTAPAAPGYPATTDMTAPASGPGCVTVLKASVRNGQWGVDVADWHHVGQLGAARRTVTWPSQQNLHGFYGFCAHRK